MIFENHELWKKFFLFGKGKGGRFHLAFEHEGQRKYLRYRTKPKNIFDEDFNVDTGFLRISYYLKDKFYFCAIYPQYQWRAGSHSWRSEPAWSNYKLFGDTTLGDVEDIMFIIGLTTTYKVNPVLA